MTTSASNPEDHPDLPGFVPKDLNLKLTASVRVIGPAEAQQLIDGSDFNRKVTKTTVAKYANDMLNGRWWENGQPLILNGKKLLNGAHRCHAIVLSGVTLPFVVVEGVHPRANRTMDIGKARTLDQMLELEGHHAPKELAQAISWLIGYLHGRHLGDARKFTVLDKFDLFAEHLNLETIAMQYTLRVPGKGLLDQGMYACCHYLFAQRSSEDAVTFMSQVITGENLQKGDPAYTYREGVQNLALESDLKRTQLVKRKCANALVFAWNKYRSKESWTKFKLIESCPDII